MTAFGLAALAGAAAVGWGGCWLYLRRRWDLDRELLTLRRDAAIEAADDLATKVQTDEHRIDRLKLLVEGYKQRGKKLGRVFLWQ